MNFELHVIEFLFLIDFSQVLQFDPIEVFIVIKRHIVRNFELFECLSCNYSMLCRYHITELKITEKPFEVNKEKNSKRKNQMM